MDKLIEQAIKNCKINKYEKYFEDVCKEYKRLLDAENHQLNIAGVSSSCSCGVKYVETKKSDIPYDTDDNVYYTDIMIYHCPKCGNIDKIEEY